MSSDDNIGKRFMVDNPADYMGNCMERAGALAFSPLKTDCVVHSSAGY